MAKLVRELVSSLVLFFCLLSISSSKRRSLDPEIEKILNDYIRDEYLPKSKTDGLGLAIVQNDGEVLYTNGYGIADIEKQKPVVNDTQFIIGSVSKMFTASALTKALHEHFPELGESVLDTPIRQLFPLFNFTLIDRFRSEHGTIRDLLSHRMCFLRSIADWPQMAEAVETREEMIYRQRYVEEVCSLRTEFQYSNHMITIAGEILAHLTGKSYEDSVRDLFNEIGMLNSTFVQKSDDFSNLPHRAKPYFVKNGETELFNFDLLKRVVVTNAAGGVVASPNEMTNFLQLYLNLGKVDGEQVIPEEVMRWIQKPAIHTPPTMSPPNKFGLAINTYGLALMIGVFSGSEYFMHSGGFPPYSSLVSLFPDKKLGIFTTTNYGPVFETQTVLHALIYELLQGNAAAVERASEFGRVMRLHESEQQAKTQRDLNLFFKQGQLMFRGSASKAEEIVGIYGSGGSGEAEIMEQWNTETNQMELFLRYGKWAHGWLEHVSDVTYRIIFVTDLLQDAAMGGFPVDSAHIRVFNGTLEFYVPVPGLGVQPFGSFKIGVSLDKLPPIPWLPGSCGPE